MLIVHHLGVSQSERIVWLCEELGLQYELKKYDRSPVFSPPELQALHPIGAAPVIQDGDVTLAESEACAQYIIDIHGGGRLVVKPGDKGYPEYLYWYHFANGTLQPAVSVNMTLSRAGVTKENPLGKVYQERLTKRLKFVDDHLSQVAYLAGNEFTAADIMVVFTLTTMRSLTPVDLTAHKNILAYLKRVTSRDAYKRAMEKGDPEIDIQSQIKGEAPPQFKGLSQR